MSSPIYGTMQIRAQRLAVLLTRLARDDLAGERVHGQ